MGFLVLNGLNDVHAPEIHPEGRVPLCIVDATEVEKEGKFNVRVMLEIEEPHPEPGKSWATIFHYLNPPQRDDDEDKQQTKLRMLKQFLVQFNVPFDNGIDVATLRGMRAEGNIKIEEYEGTPQNKLKCDPLPKGV